VVCLDMSGSVCRVHVAAMTAKNHFFLGILCVAVVVFFPEKACVRCKFTYLKNLRTALRPID